MIPTVTASDGIADVHRSTWSRLTRLHTASVTLPVRTTRSEDCDRRGDTL